MTIVPSWLRAYRRAWLGRDLIPATLIVLVLSIVISGLVSA